MAEQTGDFYEPRINKFGTIIVIVIAEVFVLLLLFALLLLA